MKRLPTKIIIKADSFENGNLNRNKHSFGKGIVIDGGFGYGFAEYKVRVLQSTKYELWVKYASLDERNVDIYLDDKLIAKDCLNVSTGGWNWRYLKWYRVAILYIPEGIHKLKIYTQGFIPHIERFELRIQDERDFRTQGWFDDVLEIYKHSIPFQIFFRSLIKDGIQITFERVWRYIKSGNLMKDYLDYMGIFDGSFAYKGPNFVQLDITNSCNNNCIGCWCNSPLLGNKAMKPEEKKERLPLPLVIQLIDELHSMGTREIYLSGGGEPFTHPDILPILRYIKKKDLICYINTNFTLIDELIVKELIKLNIEHLTVSIWAGTPETYEITHPNKTRSTFFKIKNMLKKLNLEKPHYPLIKLYNVIFNLNFHEINKMIQFALDTCSESVEFTMIDTIPKGTDKLLLNEQQRLQLMEECRQIQTQKDKGYFKDKLILFRFNQFLRRISTSNYTLRGEYDKGFLDQLPCYVGWVFSRINANGDVNPCLKAHRIPVGNIYKDRFKNIWNSYKQREFRNITLTQDKSHPYFSFLGNDPASKTGCYKSCDDIGRNIHTHKKIMSLSIPEKYLLKCLVSINKIRKNYINKKRNKVDKSIHPLSRINLSSPKKCNFITPGRKDISNWINDNLDLAGVLDSQKAFIGPEQVVIDLTNRCDTRCVACWMYSPYLGKYKPSKEWLNTELSYKSVEKLIDQLHKVGTRRIRFTGGGEPLLHSRIFDLCEYVKHKKMKCAITTNFLRITKKNLDRLKHLDELAVSIWAASESMYEKIHPNRKKSDFNRIIELLTTLIESRNNNSPSVTICNVLMNINYFEIMDMYNLAHKLKVDTVYFTPIDVITGATDRFRLTPEQKLFILKKLNEIKNLNKNTNLTVENYEGFRRRLITREGNNIEYDREEVDSIPCYVGWIFTRILANGDVCPCCRAVEKPMGNIYKDSFSDIWYSERYNEFRCKAKYLKKSHPYFKKIHCFKECDNLMHNRIIHNRIRKLTTFEKQLLKKLHGT